MSTPRLIRSLHTMSPAKAAPDVLQESRAQERALREPLRIHMYQKRRYGATSSCKELWYARGFSHSREVCPKSDRKKGSSRSTYKESSEPFAVALRSRNSSETMVEASTECSTTLRFQRFSRRESFAPREASRGLC